MQKCINHKCFLESLIFPCEGRRIAVIKINVWNAMKKVSLNFHKKKEGFSLNLIARLPSHTFSPTKFVLDLMSKWMKNRCVSELYNAALSCCSTRVNEWTKSEVKRQGKRRAHRILSSHDGLPCWFVLLYESNQLKGNKVILFDLTGTINGHYFVVLHEILIKSTRLFTFQIYTTTLAVITLEFSLYRSPAIELN